SVRIPPAPQNISSTKVGLIFFRRDENPLRTSSKISKFHKSLPLHRNILQCTHASTTFLLLPAALSNYSPFLACCSIFSLVFIYSFSTLLRCLALYFLNSSRVFL